MKQHFYDSSNTAGIGRTVREQLTMLAEEIHQMFPNAEKEDITIYIYSFSHRQTEEIDVAMTQRSILQESRNTILEEWETMLKSKGFKKAQCYTGWWEMEEYQHIIRADGTIDLRTLSKMPKGAIWKKLHELHPNLDMILIDDKEEMLDSAARTAQGVSGARTLILKQFVKYEGSIKTREPFSSAT
jgi:hypothetical protein